MYVTVSYVLLKIHTYIHTYIFEILPTCAIAPVMSHTDYNSPSK